MFAFQSREQSYADNALQDFSDWFQRHRKTLVNFFSIMTCNSWSQIYFRAF